MAHQATVIRHFLGQTLGYPQQFGGRAGEAIEPGYHQDITFAQLFDQPLKLGPIASGAGGLFFEQLFASGGGKALALAVEGLISVDTQRIRASCDRSAGFAKPTAKVLISA